MNQEDKNDIIDHLKSIEKIFSALAVKVVANKELLPEPQKSESEGYFKVGDCVGVSGNYIGIVMIADSKKFGISRLVPSDGGYLLCPDISMYSNESKDYQDKYWISKVPAPPEYKEMKVTPIKF